jgi:hypothetical protein
MAVPSILAAVIAIGVLEKALCWRDCAREGGYDEAKVAEGRSVDLEVRRRFRPRDLGEYLTATPGEAEARCKYPEVLPACGGRGKSGPLRNGADNDD